MARGDFKDRLKGYTEDVLAPAQAASTLIGNAFFDVYSNLDTLMRNPALARDAYIGRGYEANELLAQAFEDQRQQYPRFQNTLEPAQILERELLQEPTDVAMRQASEIATGDPEAFYDILEDPRASNAMRGFETFAGTYGWRGGQVVRNRPRDLDTPQVTAGTPGAQKGYIVPAHEAVIALNNVRPVQAHKIDLQRQQAMQMINAGAAYNEVEAATGLLVADVGGVPQVFYQTSPTGKVDLDAIKNASTNFMSEHRLGDIYDDPELYEIYPEMANRKITLRPDISELGWRTDDEIAIRQTAAPNSPQLLSDADIINTFGHEIAHDMQERFFMPRGANPSIFPTYPQVLDTTGFNKLFGQHGFFKAIDRPSSTRADRIRRMQERLDYLNKEVSQYGDNLPPVVQQAKIRDQRMAEVLENGIEWLKKGNSWDSALKQMSAIAASPTKDYYRTWGEAAARLEGEALAGQNPIRGLQEQLLREGGVYSPSLLVERYGGNMPYMKIESPLIKTDYIYGDMPDFPEGSATKRQVAEMLQAEAQAYWGGRMPETPENFATVADNLFEEAWAKFQREPEIAEWYRQNLQRTLEVAATRYPEILTDKNARTAFLLIKAVTSNGQKVTENVKWTIQQYEKFRQTGKFEVWGTGKESAQMKKAFKHANDLIEKIGWDDFNDFLRKDFTRRELEEAGFKIGGEVLDANVKGSAIFGPKIGGGFFQNLDGNFKPVTFDMWWQRTWGRHTGTLLATPEQIAKNRNELRLAIRDNPDLIKGMGYRINQVLPKEGRKASVKQNENLDALAGKLHRRFAQGSYEDKNPVHNAARNLDKRFEPVDAPYGGKNRMTMREIVSMVSDRFKERGVEMENAAIQALLWYVEKDLYRKLGVRGPKRVNDYATAWEEALR